MKNSQNDGRYFPAKYISRFLNLNSAEDLLYYFRSSNTIKEISESMGIYYAITDYLCKWDNELSLKDNNVSVVVCGDGILPRTASLITYMTKWNVISCDPLMKNEVKPANRLITFSCIAEDLDLSEVNDKVILIFPHSHVKDINAIYNKVKDKKVWIVNLPCCIKSQINNLPFTYFSYRDKFIFSSENLIQIFCNFKNLSFE